MSDSRIQRFFRSHAVRFGSLALALGFISFEVIWCWATQGDNSTLRQTTRQVDFSKELSMEELYNALEAGRFEVVHDHLDSLMQTMPPADDWNYGNVCHHYLTLFGLLGLYESNDLERAKNSLRLAARLRARLN